MTMELTLQQAADLTGKSKSTIFRAVKSGALSASRRQDGTYRIAPAELLRVYPAQHVNRHGMTHHAMTDRTDETPPQDDAQPHLIAAAVMEAKVELLTAQLEREQETVTDLRRRLDRAEDRLLALSAPAQNNAPAKSLWARLWGR